MQWLQIETKQSIPLLAILAIFAEHVFITLHKLKQPMNLQIFLHAQGPIPKKSTRDIFLEHLNSET